MQILSKTLTNVFKPQKIFSPEIQSDQIFPNAPSMLISQWSTVIDRYWKGLQIVTYCEGDGILGQFFLLIKTRFGTCINFIVKMILP